MTFMVLLSTERLKFTVAIQYIWTVIDIVKM